MGEAVQSAPAGKRLHYERRRPEDTVLYPLVQEHLETLPPRGGPSLGLASLAQVELETGAGLPDFVEDEFDAFLECGSPPAASCAYAAPTAPKPALTVSHSGPGR